MRISQFAAMAAVAGLIAALTAGCGPEEYKAKTGGSEEFQQKAKTGQPLYTPPPGAIQPGKSGPATIPTPPSQGGSSPH